MTRMTPRGARRASSESGVILIWATLTMMMVAGVILAATDDLKAVDQVTKGEFTARGQSQQVAMAGLVDAYAWFRRQPTQPVEGFWPELDLDSEPVVNETENPNLGLVRTFEISPSIWARYEVRRGTDAESYTDSNQNGIYDAGESFTDTSGDGKWSPGLGTRDVSAERGQPDGTVWEVVSVATVFRRSRADMPLGMGPNRRLARGAMSAEIRRLAVNPPAAAAICCKNGGDVSLGNRARVRAGSTAIAYSESSGSPSTSGAEVMAARTSVPNYNGALDAVFGVNWTELKSMADLSTADGATGMPKRVPNYSLIVVGDSVTFDSTKPLAGMGILVIEGDCTIEAGSNSFFSGMLYVKGNLTVRAPAFIRGTVICEGDVDMRGTGGDYVEIEHDDGILDALLAKMGQYRWSKAPFKPRPRLTDGRPSELSESRRRLGGADYAGGLGVTDITSDKGTLDPNAGDDKYGGEIPKGFVPGPLIDTIDGLLTDNADTLTKQQKEDLHDAIDKLKLAESYMARDPRFERPAIRQVKKAVKLIRDVVEDTGVSGEQFINTLDNGPSTLYPQMVGMVQQLIDNSQADSDKIDNANTELTNAQTKMQLGRDRHAAGNDVGSLDAYDQAAGKLLNALNALK
ncbi:MAG: hypothetical protein QNJ98_11075 [Planctomycetota bacterium]|nr:hypothetical protein [Planctomycetota bacterium]